MTTPELLFELDKYVGRGSQVTILAETPAAEREELIRRKGRRLGIVNFSNIQVNHHEGAPLSRTDSKRAAAEVSKDANGDGGGKVTVSVIIVADGNWGSIGGEKGSSANSSDKRVIFSSLLAEDVLNQAGVQYSTLIAEVTDRALGKQMKASESTRNVGYISSSELMGLFTAQVVEHNYLRQVWTQLLSAYGFEFYLKDLGLYTTRGQPKTFRELEEAAAARGEIAVGYITAKKNGKRRTVVNPLPKDAPIPVLSSGDQIIVISNKTT